MHHCSNATAAFLYFTQMLSVAPTQLPEGPAPVLQEHFTVKEQAVKVGQPPFVNMPFIRVISF
jgi:hypothetical protein